MSTIYETIKLEAITCGQCGMTFGVPDHWLKQRRDNGGGFHCPNGHERVFRESEVNRLRGEIRRIESRLALERSRLDQERKAREETERSLVATKGVVTKLKRRAAGGACPCCNRTFQNLQRHMKTKHPGFAQEPTP